MTNIKIDKTSLLLAFIISITLTILFLSTYEHEESGNSTESLGENIIKEIFEESHRQYIIQTTIFTIILFCIELIIFYFVIYKLKMWKQSKK